MNYENKILNLFNAGYLKTIDVKKNKISSVYLTKLLKKGVIERVSRGLYIKGNDLADDMVVLQSKSKNAIYSYMTALYLHKLSNRNPIKYDITVPNGYNGSLQKNSKVNLHYTKKEFINLGTIEFKTDSGVLVKTYDLERTICDIVKNKKQLDSELYNKAIREYFYSKSKNSLKLHEYALKLNITKKIDNVFEVLR